MFSQHILDFQHITCSARYLLLAAFNHTSADTKKTVEGFTPNVKKHNAARSENQSPKVNETNDLLKSTEMTRSRVRMKELDSSFQKPCHLPRNSFNLIRYSPRKKGGAHVLPRSLKGYHGHRNQHSMSCGCRNVQRRILCQIFWRARHRQQKPTRTHPSRS